MKPAGYLPATPVTTPIPEQTKRLAPSGTLAELWRARQLLWVLTRREFAARYLGSVAGVAWAFAPPLLTIAAYYLVFDLVFAMRLGNGAPTERVGTYLIVGALPWMAFCDAMSRGTSSLLDAGGLLQKNPLPPSLFPVRSVLASAIAYGPLLLLLPIAYLPVSGLGAHTLALPFLWTIQAMLALLLAHIAALLAAAVRDTIQVVTFLLSIGIFLSPVLFPISLFPRDWQWVLYFNPMTPLVLGYQEVLLQGQWPGAQTWVPALAWCMLAALVLRVLWRRCQDQLVDWL